MTSGVNGGLSYQARVWGWVRRCFQRPDATSVELRAKRFLEEALELAQASGISIKDAAATVDYVYGRPVGEMRQELGGVACTLASLAEASGNDLQEGAETELARCERNIDRIREKDLRKPIGRIEAEPAPK